MAKKKKEIDGQLCINMCLEAGNYVVQHNDLIEGKHNLNLTSAKLIRLAIMQIKPEDKELKPYTLSIKEFADLTGASKNTLYRDAEKIKDDILQHPVEVKINNDFVALPWVQAIGYKSEHGFAIQLNSLLKPYLLELKNHYTQYQLENILTMKSVYAIRIFELLEENPIMRYLPKNGADIEIPILKIREVCSCENKLKQFVHFKERVLEQAVKEINRCTIFDVSYKCESRGKGKTMDTVIFHVNLFYR